MSNMSHPRPRMSFSLSGLLEHQECQVPASQRLHCISTQHRFAGTGYKGSELVSGDEDEKTKELQGIAKALIERALSRFIIPSGMLSLSLKLNAWVRYLMLC